jgi:eukaryotic-like serine/threonine-protein kinase
VEEAIACYRAAIKADPKYPDAHYCLGCALLSEGRFADALGPLKQGHALGSQRPDWRYPSDRSVRQCESLLALDRRLAAVLKGAEVANTIERLQLAWLCQQPFKGLYRASARLYADAFAAEPKLADDLRKPRHRDCAARAAARAAAGQGRDACNLDDRERSRLRRQAQDWLRADLAAYTQLAEKGKEDRQLVQQRLARWQQDTDLATLRDEKALAALPEKERMAWRQLWADVAALRKKVEKKE